MDSNLFKSEPNKLNDLRKVDNEVGTLVADICDLILRNDYRRAATASAYLLLNLAIKSKIKPFTLLRSVK